MLLVVLVIDLTTSFSKDNTDGTTNMFEDPN